MNEIKFNMSFNEEELNVILSHLSIGQYKDVFKVIGSIQQQAQQQLQQSQAPQSGFNESEPA